MTNRDVDAAWMRGLQEYIQELESRLGKAKELLRASSSDPEIYQWLGDDDEIVKHGYTMSPCTDEP